MPCCPLCKDLRAIAPAMSTRRLDITCQACGHYCLTLEAQASLGQDPKLAFDLASWTSEQAQQAVIPRIDTATIEWMRTYPRPGTGKRAELYLGAAIRSLGGKLTGRISISDPRLRVASWSYDSNDCISLANHCVDIGALEPIEGGQEMRVLAKGHLLYEETATRRASSSQAFVAMWFDTSMKAAFDGGIEPAVRAAGFEAFRIDLKEYSEKIDDQIIAEIRRSSFVVADFTGHRGGVYYEVGFAHGLGLRVIFSCREDHISNLHFDVRQYNTILWNDPEKLRLLLQNRILALFGAGPLNFNAAPVTT